MRQPAASGAGDLGALSAEAGGDPLHDEVAHRLGAVNQRYTAGRRAIIDVLSSAPRPLTVPEILGSPAGAGLRQSSAYRNLTVLVEAGVVHRMVGDDLGRFELVEDLSGHHHHLVCDSCGVFADVTALPRLERALAEAARLAADETGFVVTGNRIDLVGRCVDCR